ncbi:bifunctional DNA primase/polymerase, partial [Patescibacteria group bacterium]|nr:bifunctional DNA primase/polymerase [Patescibacteria group bacterium]
GIAAITGKVSGFVVLDLDAKHSRSSEELRKKGFNIPSTTCARSGGGGEHHLFKYPNQRFKNRTGDFLDEGVDFKTDGGYIIVAPSIHESGKAYEWMVPPEEGTAEMPEWLIEKLHEAENRKTDWRTLLTHDVSEGMRHTVAISIAGGLLYATDPDQWDTVAWSRLQKWNNEHCKPPLTEKELRTSYESIAATEQKKRDDLPELEEKSPQKMELMKLVTSNPNIELFRDNYGNGHAWAVVDGHKEVMVCKGLRFKQWLTHSYLERYGNVADPGSLNAAIHTIDSMAVFRGKEYKLHNRVAKIGDVIWLDLADERNRAIKITNAGWNIVDEPPILFRRHTHQKEQIEPQRGGDIKKLFEFITVSDPDQQLLLLVYLVSCFIPDFPHALLYIHGQHGSSKSTLCRILRRLVDPSKTEVLHMPKEERELKLQLSRHHLVFYENVDGISTAISTVLCIGVTGGSSSERLYFTNGEDFIFDFQLNIGINGINISAVKPDLLDRCLLFELEPVEEYQRRDEKEIFKGFEVERPKILGAILDVVAKALTIYPGVKIIAKPRMADFALWGVAIAEALGHTREQFLNAYSVKISEQSEEALAESVEAAALIIFMADKTVWEGTARQLLNELSFVDVERGVDSQHQRISTQQLPKQPQVLIRQLNEMKPNLRKIGIEISRRRENGTRMIAIRKIDKNTDQIVNTDQEDWKQDMDLQAMDDNDDIDDVSPTSTEEPIPPQELPF